eukprot:772646-Pyramimonas_sp.AAC.1
MGHASAGGIRPPILRPAHVARAQDAHGREGVGMGRLLLDASGRPSRRVARMPACHVCAAVRNAHGLWLA